MKNSYLAIALLSSILIQARADTVGTGAQTPPNQADLPAPTPYAVVDRGANNRVWEQYTYEKAPGGKVVAKKHQFTEMATGMHYLKDGQWVESKEQIDILPQGGAAATQGQHQVYFPSDIYQGVIEVVTPDGRHLKSRPMGVGYDDGENTVLIAELKSSIGQLVAPNKVVYPDAFTGFKADLVCTYRRGGFECDLVFRQQPPAPDKFGLNPRSSRLQLLTEFFDSPEPAQTQLTSIRQYQTSDSTLKFGAMIMGHGKAFDFGSSSSTQPGIPVLKSWLHLQNRTFLLEEVPFPQIAPILNELPPSASIKTGDSAKGLALHKVSPSCQLVASRPIQTCTNAIQLAKADLNRKPGVVLDYIFVNADQGDFTFQADTTYLIAGGGYNFSGVTTFEGGTVIKFETDPDNGCIIQSWDVNVCATSPYRPAIFTSVNDDTVGEPISEPGTAMNYLEALAGDAASSTQWRYVHIRYGNYGIQGNTQMHVSDSQFVNCGYPFFVYWGPGYYTNNLLVNVGSAFYGNDFQATVYHMTINGCTNQLVVDFWSESASTVSFVNSLLVNVGADGDATVTTNYTVRIDTNNVFQVVGAGSCYLPTNSPYLNAGTTNIDSSILADIATKTTYPPIVYSNTTISVATTFSPQAQRDTDAPDLGYHYDPIDYFFGGVDVNSNLTFTAGTAFGWFGLPGSSWWGPGVSLANNAVATFNGTLASPCFYACYDTVQEGCNNIWPDEGRLGGITGGGIYDPNNPSQVNAYFTHFTCLPGQANLFRDGPGGEPIRFHATDCEIYRAGGGYNPQMAFTNCLFFRSGAGQATADSQYGFEGYREIYRNCTFYGGWLEFDHWEGPPYWQVSIRDCSFDGTTLNFNPPWNDTTTNWDWTWLDADYNATNNVTFLENADLTALPGPNNVAPSGGFNWQSSWFGDFYVPTNSVVINAGDRTADTIGLYHFTTLVNQGKETNSVVDIGYHYVATDQYGNPIDSNGDGIPDYLADANGNGLVDNGEIPWNDIFSLGVLITQPRNGGTLP